MKDVVDIHTHILYGIDDGAKNFEMSLQLLNMEHTQGITKVFLTNHSYDMEYTYIDYNRKFEQLREIVQRKYSNLDIYKGCEILCFKNEMTNIINNIRNNIYPTMNETQYVLIEFNPYDIDGIREIEYCLKYLLDKGYIPIIAHAERYGNSYDNPLENIIKIKELGCKIQINLYSIKQENQNSIRRTLANLFLNNKDVDFVGTDTHRLDYKPTEAYVGIQTIRKQCDSKYSDDILFRNSKMLNINF